jgi:hypothetical protein
MPKFKVKCRVKIIYDYVTEIEANDFDEASDIAFSDDFYFDQLDEVSNRIWKHQDFDLDVVVEGK